MRLTLSLDEAKNCNRRHCHYYFLYFLPALLHTAIIYDLSLRQHFSKMLNPFSNTTALPQKQWHPEPQFRGTFHILSSCLITMSLCIWTLLHLNLPGHKRRRLQNLRKLCWMVLGLLAPELVVWNALEQRRIVRQLSKFMQEQGYMPREPEVRERIRTLFAELWWKVRCLAWNDTEDRPESAVPEAYLLQHGRKHPWTDAHSWFVVMGGIVCEDTAPEGERFMPGGRQRIPLDLGAFVSIAREQPHLVPDFSRQYIDDKSKSDWLAKFLTFWQALYFCIQCVFRLSQDLSITLLELNVFAHVAFALLLIFIWWDKPRDINEPTVITHDEALDICACMLHNSAYRDTCELVYVDSAHNPQSYECLEINEPGWCETLAQDEDSEKPGYVAVSGSSSYRYLKVRDTCWTLRKSANDVPWPWQEWQDWRHGIVVLDRRRIMQLERVDRWMKARSTTATQPMPQSNPLESAASMRFCDRISNLSSSLNSAVLGSSTDDSFSAIWFILVFGFEGAFYGGLHFVAWSSSFPSDLQALMWHAACVTTILTGPLIGLTFGCIYLFDWVTTSNWWVRFGKSSFFVNLCIEVSVNTLGIAAFVVLSLWYLLCRIFLVIECFVLLAYLSESHLKVPSWSVYFPHIA
jgi:hypothetical protein